MMGRRLGSPALVGALLTALAGFSAGVAQADRVHVAVAANFAPCLEALAPLFAEETGHHLVLSRGSTGRHFAQIKAGAPFDVFLAADSDRPTRLEDEGLIVPGSRITYAEGRLALWLPNPGPGENRTAADYLKSDDFNHLAIANPRLAPYGLAARQVLENLQLWDGLQDRLVTGQNVGQAWQFVATGNATAGLVAYPQLLGDAPPPGRWWTLDPPLHQPILQQGVVLKHAAHPTAALALLDFLQGPAAMVIMIRYGYLIPEN